MTVRQRTPADCPHRLQSGEQASCDVIARLVDLPDSGYPIQDDACLACCEFPVPDAHTLNPVIASLVSGATETFLKSGHPRLDSKQLAEIQSRARANLRSDRSNDPAAYFEKRDVTPCHYLGPSEDAVHYDCRHPQHEVTTLTECRWCRDWTELADQSSPRDLDDVVQPPKQRHGAPVQHWAVGVTTSPRDQPTVGLSMDSLVRAGWRAPVIFSDGSVTLPERFDQFHVVRRSSQLGAWPNFLLGLQELLFAEPDADAYLMVQDDAVFCDGVDVRQYLEQSVLWPGSELSIISLYCPEPYTTEPDTWHQRKDAWIWGALAFVFPREIARALVMDRTLLEHRWRDDRKGQALIDVVIGEWALRNNVPIYYPVPSLVQHIGHVSTVFAGNHVLGPRCASRFAGDEIHLNDSQPG